MAARATPPSDSEYLGMALRRSHLALAVDQITEPWSNMILREAFMGTRQFEDFQHQLKIPRQTLSLRLAYLVRIGLLRKQPGHDHSARHDYRLTARGKDLHANVLASWLWDRRWGDPQQRIPKRLVHTLCQHEFKPQLVCEHCADPLSLRQMQPRFIRSARRAPARADRSRRWRSPNQEGAWGNPRDLLSVIDDRWSLLTVASIMLGLERFDQISAALQISSSVLARRLHRLVALELLDKRPDAQDARRSVYRLAQAGRELFSYLLTLSRWGAGASRAQTDSIQWTHAGCGEDARGQMVCGHCHKALLVTQVQRATRVALA